jgi:hypothetical protein
MAAPIRRSRMSRSVLRMSFVSAGGTARVGRRAGACSDEDMCEGPSEGENCGGKSTIVGEKDIPQKEVENVGDRHLPRKKGGPEESGKDVESQRGSFSRAGTVEVDDAEETLDNKEKGIAPCAMDGEEPGTEEGHELVIAGGAERRCGVRERGRSVRKRRREDCGADDEGGSSRHD